MFELGFSELVLIALVAILVIGPQQLPGLMYKIGKFMRQLGYTRFALEKQFESFMEKEDSREREQPQRIEQKHADRPSDGAA